MKTTTDKPTTRPDYTGRRLPEPQRSDFPNPETFNLCAWALTGTSIDELVNFDPALTIAGRKQAGWIVQLYIEKKFAPVDLGCRVYWADIGDWVIAQIQPRP